jgi:hypothetical protein
MEMPRSIRLFEKLFLSSLALGVVQGALRGIEIGLNAVLYLATYNALMMGILVALVLLTSRKKSVICKWINTVFVFVGILYFALTLNQQGLVLMQLISFVQIFMQGYAIYLLFNASSKAWFASKKNTTPGTA